MPADILGALNCVRNELNLKADDVNKICKMQ